MTIYGKGLIRAMKSAFRDNGYDLAMTENGLLIQTADWGVQIRNGMVPSSIKSLIVLHSGDMPRMNTAIHVHKSECNDMILDNKRVWQLADNLNVRLVDLDNQQVMTLLIGERLDTRLMNGVIYLRHWAGTVYFRTEMILQEDRVLMQHLSEMQWIPVELE